MLNFWKFTSYCSLKLLWSGMGEVVPARTSPTLHPPSHPTMHQLSWLALLDSSNAPPILSWTDLHVWPYIMIEIIKMVACQPICRLHYIRMQLLQTFRYICDTFTLSVTIFTWFCSYLHYLHDLDFPELMNICKINHSKCCHGRHFVDKNMQPCFID